ncbi:hypothetical protein LSTR_LSTR007687 [Laodelphax striatellus]|uniref:Uncharacterized protein n=1 Tax=Laodelphax striatellus TaxID=195883 RepID=A0A482WJB4_LAOST|nr:hypothetical protein LSTR_LSTR007687 [Laodelphax striatellus]
MKNSVEKNLDEFTYNQPNESSEEEFRSENVNDNEVTVFHKLSKADFLKLTTVVLKGARLSSLPDIPFINVVKFDLSDNLLSSIPSSFSLLEKLQTLNLSRNQFDRVPDCLARGFFALKHLFLSENLIVNLRSMDCLSSLQLLDIHKNQIDSFPDSLISTSCVRLVELDISHNFCFKKEKSIDELLGLLCRPRRATISQSLKNITLSNCQLVEKCSETNFLELLPNLRELNLTNDGSLEHKKLFSNEHNFLPKIPLSSMMNMKHLCVLKLSNVSLRDLTDKISEFRNLEILELKNNYLNWLPDGFCDLKNLELCDLSNNELYLLPDKIGNLSKLSVLLLPFNPLSDLPESLGQLENLKFLDLYFNQISKIPEVFLNLNLEGIDVENNHFDSSSLPKSMNYSMLLNELRSKYQLTRILGYRPEVEISVSSDSDSSQLEASSYSEKSGKDVPTCHSISSVELWDTEEDEDDLFNPNDFRPPCVRELNPSSRRKTSYFRVSPPVEGQFDDAESE